jgi:hypothetical protein
MYPDEQIFVWDFDALQAIGANPTPKNLLAASAILRRMLMDDGEPLLNKVCRKLAVKVRFTVSANTTKQGFAGVSDRLPQRGLTHLWINPDPCIGENPSTTDVELGEFLAVPFLIARKQTLTVK